MPSSSTTGRRPYRLLALSGLATAALTLGACGGDDDTTTTTTPTTTPDTGGGGGGGPSDAEMTTELRKVFEQQLAKRFAQQGQVTQEQSQCIIDKLRDSLSDEQILGAQQNPGPVQNAAANAALACGVGG